MPLDADRPPTDRLRHVAHIGVGARPFSYVANGREPNEAPIRVELVGPHGRRVDVGPGGRRRPGDRAGARLLPARHPAPPPRRRRRSWPTGAAADEWLGIAQSFAGPPGEGRRPGQFA